MKAAVLHGPGDLRIEDVPRPAPGPGEVVLRVEAALTGGTAAKFVRRGYHARMGQAPYRLGHEGMGTVEAVGPDVPGFGVGSRVVPANSAACGACPACERGMTAQCANLTWLAGMYAEAVLVPAPIVAGNLHPVPDGMDAATAALAENVACVLKARDRLPARSGERALVLGAGAMGLIWTRVLSLTGSEVVAVDPREDRRERAVSLGATAALDPTEYASRCDAGGERADLVIEAVGSAEAWQSAIAAARSGGRVLLFGGPPRGSTVTLDTERIHYDELSILSSFHHTPYHFAEALRSLAAGLLDVDRIVGERVALDDLPDYFRREGEGRTPPKAEVVV